MERERKKQKRRRNRRGRLSKLSEGGLWWRGRGACQRQRQTLPRLVRKAYWAAEPTPKLVWILIEGHKMLDIMHGGHEWRGRKVVVLCCVVSQDIRGSLGIWGVLKIEKKGKD